MCTLLRFYHERFEYLRHCVQSKICDALVWPWKKCKQTAALLNKKNLEWNFRRNKNIWEKIRLIKSQFSHGGIKEKICHHFFYVNSRPENLKKVQEKNSWHQINLIFPPWNCILSSFELFPSSKIDFWPFLK